jgi:hypothetical protein
VIKIPAILDKCVKDLKKQGKSEKSAWAICTATLKKAGKLDEDFLASLSDVNEGTFEFDELMVYVENHALETWKIPTDRKNIPSNHFFDTENKRYPYRNSDESVNWSGVMAAWKLANGAGRNEKTDSSLILKIKPYRDKCMESKSKKQSETEIRKFSFPLSEDIFESFELADKEKSVDVQILKTGRFRHPWWGVLRFDDKLFNTMIKNFDANVPQEEIAFDFQHRPELGAAAWVSKLFIKDNGLMATMSVTAEGKKAIKAKQFRYFSAEYTDNYVGYDFEDMENEDGVIVEREIKNSYGPCLIGGGLTNRPFIKGMKPVSLSEDGQVLEFEELEEEFDFNFLEEVNFDMKDLEKLLKEQDEIKSQIKNLEEGGKTDKKVEKKLSDLEESLKKIEDSIVKLNEKEPVKKEDTKVLDELKANLEEATKALKEKEDQVRKLAEEKEDQVKKLSKDIKALSGNVTSLMKSNEVLQDEKYKVNVENRIRQFSELGVFPATIKVIEPILLSDKAKDMVITLSEKTEDDKESKDVDYGLADIFHKIFSSIPEEFRFSDEELSRSETNPTGSSKSLSVADVQKYADDKKLSYEDALIELSKDGKITED